MRIAFVSNFYNHHQDPISNCLDKELNGGYAFISTEKMDGERLAMGWGYDSEPSFVYHYSEEPEKCEEIINDYEVVIVGSAPYSLVKKRLKKGKLTFLYSERLFKKKVDLLRYIKYKFIYHHLFGRFKNCYLLCASAFASYDYSRMLSFRNKSYRWGYFPKAETFSNVDSIIRDKNKTSLLFVSRLIELKHPELPVLVAKRLKNEGFQFSMTIIGRGVLESKIFEMIKEYNLNNEIVLISHLAPSEVRQHMIKSSIFLFTSDRNEGWGAVLNEAMNSGCAVVASSAIGSVPFLLKNGENGFIYKDGDFEDLYSKVKALCLSEEKQANFGVNAYKTITNSWCAEIAAKRLITLINDIINNGKSNRFSEGPCSIAEILNDNWFDNK